MRLKQFINESRGKVLSLDDTKKLLQTKCKKAVEAHKKGNVIYRGIPYGEDYIYVSPSKFTRKSANTENYYTLINDNSPAWAKYPKRSKSIICTTDYEDAKRYGIPYTVFPLDGAKIGLCSDSDYWFSFPFLKKVQIHSMAIFNEQLYDLFNIRFVREYTGPLLKINTYKDLKNKFNRFDYFVEEYDEELEADAREDAEEKGVKYKKPDFSYTIRMLIEDNPNITLLKEYDKFMNLEKYLQYLLDPKRNEFELIKITDTVHGPHEVWTDSDSILIRVDKINSVLQ